MCAIIDNSSGHAYIDKLYHSLMNNITAIEYIDPNFILNNYNIN